MFVSYRKVLQLTTSPVDEVLSDARAEALSGCGPWSNQPTLLTDW